MKQFSHLHKTVFSALFLALCLVLPFLTGQIPKLGAMLCPMHLPVLFCGYLCGGAWGALVGFSAPLLRAVILGMPPLFPTAVCMAAELCAYGAFSGLLHRALPKRGACTYLSLVLSMLLGRAVWGLSMLLCMSAVGEGFTLAAFLAGAFTGSLPGILLQLLLVPPVVMFLTGQKTVSEV